MKRYSEYKNSGVRWIGEIPENWDVVKLKRICRIKRGASPRPIDDPIYFDDNGERYWVRIADVTRSNKYLVECEQKLSPLGIENSVKIDEGDLFISICASVGKPCISQVKACIHDGFVLLDRLLTPYKNYIYYIFVLELPCHGLGKIGTQLNLNSETIGNIDIPLHDNIEPICAYLDRCTTKIDELLADLQSQADLLDRYKRELIADAVTHGLDKTVSRKDSGVDWLGKVPSHWELSRFRHLFKFGRGINITKADLQDEGLPCVTYGDIHSRYGFELNPNEQVLRCVGDEYLVSAKNSMLRKGDFIFADTSEDLEGSGNFTYLSNKAEVIAGYHTIIARPKTPESSRFIAYLFDSIPFRTQIRSRVCGTKVFSITQAILKDTIVLIPPIEEQKAITAYLDKKINLADNLIADINKQIVKLKQYRQIVIYDAVTGKIKVKEMQDNGN